VRESGDLADDVTEKLTAEIEKVKSRFAATDQEAA
jgi:hypothetical protein